MLLVTHTFVEIPVLLHPSNYSVEQVTKAKREGNMRTSVIHPALNSLLSRHVSHGMLKQPKHFGKHLQSPTSTTNCMQLRWHDDNSDGNNGTMMARGNTPWCNGMDERWKFVFLKPPTALALKYQGLFSFCTYMQMWLKTFFFFPLVLFFFVFFVFVDLGFVHVGNTR